MAVGLKDIARELDISESLVSKVLSGRMGSTGASPGMMEAIQGTAQKMGYSRNRTASALASGKHSVIGVFVHHHGLPGSDISEALTRSIAARATEQGQRLWLQYFETREEFLDKAGDVNQSEVDGLLVAGVAHRDMLADFIGWQKQGLPVVTIHPEPLAPDLSNVGCTDRSIGRTAAAHLLDGGCRRPAHVGVDGERRFGFLEVLAERGIEPDADLDVVVQGYGYDAGANGFEQLLGCGKAFDGIMADSDHIGLGVLHGLLLAGVSVPDDVSIVGVDNSPICELSPVKLSSVSQEFGARGRLAVDLLMRAIDGKPCKSASVDPVLFHRESS